MTTRTFHLQRDIDITGASGTGHVADGVVWPDGTVTIRWRGERASTVNWNDLDDAEAVHGHGGATTIVFDDGAPADYGKFQQALSLLREVTSEEDCWFDHSGGCQAHGYLSLEPGETCPHADARELLAATADGETEA